MPKTADTKTELTKQVELVLQQSEGLVVNDDDSYQRAAEIQKGLKALRDKIKEWFDPHVERARAPYNALLAERKALVDPLEKKIDANARSMGTYHAELERQRREDEEILRRKAAEEAARANREAAALAELDGDKEMADGLRAAETTVSMLAAAAVQVDAMTPEVDGARRLGTWKFDVVDANKIPREFLTPDLKAIGAFVRARKEAAVIPGVRTYCDYKVSV